MSPNAQQIAAATARWIAEADRFPPAEAAKMLRRKARWVAEQITRRAGDAFALNVAEGDLLAAARRLAATA